MREKFQFYDKSYLDSALDACEKFNQEFDATFDEPEPIANDSGNITNVKLKYDLQNDVVLRLISLKKVLN